MAVTRKSITKMLAVLAVTGVLMGCAGPSQVDDRAQPAPGVGALQGRAIQAAALSPANGKIAVVDGLGGSARTVQVTFPGGRALTMSEEVPLVGVQVWEWNNHLVIAGTDCEDFDPSSAKGTTGEDCGTTDTSVVSFDLHDHSFDVLARHVAGERPPGPVLGDRLLLDGGRAELDLQSGDVAATDPYPTIGSLPCPDDSGLLLMAVDQGDLQRPDEPIRWTSKAFHRSASAGSWTRRDTTALDALLDGAAAAGIAGCGPSGPLAWRFENHQVEVFALQVKGSGIVADPFDEPTRINGPPIVTVDATGKWIALDPVVPSQDPDHRVMLSAGSGWHTADVGRGPLRAGKWAVDDDSVVYLERSSNDGWQLDQIAIR